MKAIKLLLIAIVLVGSVVGLLLIKPSGKQIEEPEFVSERANEWKEKINKLCTDDNWSVDEYESIASGIHTDNVVSKGELINNEEESTLLKYLFAKSCSSLFENTDTHFKQKSYSDKHIEKMETAYSFLSKAEEEFSTNSNLSDVTKMLTEYKRLKRMLGFSSKAVYSKPFKAFSAPSATEIKNSIYKMTYYKSHFSNNASISEKISSLAKNRKDAEEKYYENLERLIEENYNLYNDLTILLDDQMSFLEISTNSSTIEKLNSFVNSTYNN